MSSKSTTGSKMRKSTCFALWTMGLFVWGFASINRAWAAYPETKLTASDGAASDKFGFSVAISGDYAIVGAQLDDDVIYDSGSAYVYHRNGTGWTQQEKLTASDPREYGEFGHSVSISGDYAIVGAYHDDRGGYPAGAAYLFRRSGTNWTEMQKLPPPNDLTDYRHFGLSVSISGDYCIVGSWSNDAGENSGSAHIYHSDGTSWTRTNKLTASDPGKWHYFGRSVSIDGDYAIVGASSNTNAACNPGGSAYIYERNAGGADNWGQVAKLTGSDVTSGNRFGSSVSINGDYAIAGADWHNNSCGAAYVFERDPSGWTEIGKLTASDGAQDDWFGASVSVDNNFAAVGAYGDDDAGACSGSVYVFCRNESGWTQVSKLTGSDTESNDLFGYSVSLSGTSAIVGAYEDYWQFSPGAAYVYDNVPEPATLSLLAIGGLVIIRRRKNRYN